MYYSHLCIVMLGNRIGTDGTAKLLGNWFIPLMLLLNLALYFIITVGLRIKKSINLKLKKS